jgi:hypothetical protein
MLLASSTQRQGSPRGDVPTKNWRFGRRLAAQTAQSYVVAVVAPPAETADSRFARDEKELRPQLGGTINRGTASKNRRDLTHEPSAQPACSVERNRSA